MPFGYIGQNQTKQQVKNTGVFSSFDISLLEKQGHAGGSLELIQTISSDDTQYFAFTNAEGYDVYCVKHRNTRPANDSGSDTEHFSIRLGNNGNYATNGIYDIAKQYGGSNSSHNEQIQQNATEWGYLNGYTNYDFAGSGTFYFYGMNDATSYSYTTFHSYGVYGAGDSQYRIGSGALKDTAYHNSIQFSKSNYTEDYAGTFSLYGIK